MAGRDAGANRVRQLDDRRPCRGVLHLLAILLLLAVFAWKSRITRLLVLAFLLVVALAAGPDLIITDRPVFALPWGGLWSLPIA